MKRLIVISSLLLLSGCVSVDKAAKVMRAHPDELAKLCADCFPVKPIEIKSDSIFIKGETITRRDTIKGDCPDGTVIKIPCPECKETTPDTIKLNTVIKVRDTAYERVIESEKDELKIEVDKLTANRDKWRKIALWVIGLLAVYFGGRFVISRIKNRLTF